jgi:transglutaminase-like putative cysteine protease
MPIEQEELINKEQTLARMTEIVKTRADDLVPNNEFRLSFYDWFNRVRKIPYQADIKGIEILATPEIILQGASVERGADCKKKAILIASWFEVRGVPWRFVTSSTRKDKKMHHVFVQFENGAGWVNADATYPKMRIGDTKRVTASEVYQG